MSPRTTARDDRGASSTLGVVLMVAVVVVVVGAVGLWTVGSFGSLLGPSAPSTSFDVTYNASDGTVTVLDVGGKRIDAGNTGRLALRLTDASTGRTETVSWANASSGFPVTAGATLTVGDVGSTADTDAGASFQFEAGDTVDVVWHANRGGTSVVLASYSVPADSRSLDAYASGLRYGYYEADGSYTSLPDFDAETAAKHGVASQVSLAPAERGDDFAFRWTGYVQVPEDGTYTFATRSDDGSEVFVDGTRVVDNRGRHSPRTRSGTVTLDAGLHPITVTYFEHGGGTAMDLRWDGPNVTAGTVPASRLYHENAVVASFTTTCAGLNCSFDANGTQSPGATVREYRWDFGDGTTATTTSPTTSHTYPDNASYTVTLTAVGPRRTDDAIRTADPEYLRPADAPGATSPGLAYEYFEASDEYTSLPDFDAETPAKTGTVSNVNISVRDRGSDYAFRFTGYVEVPEDGRYRFWTASDDGSRLYIGDERVVDNPGLHAREEQSGTVDLAEGKHRITIVMFEHTGQEVLDVYWAGPGFTKEPIPDANLSYASVPSLAGLRPVEMAGQRAPRSSVAPSLSQRTDVTEASATRTRQHWRAAPRHLQPADAVRVDVEP
jgi:flagellin-like protein